MLRCAIALQALSILFGPKRVAVGSKLSSLEVVIGAQAEAMGNFMSKSESVTENIIDLVTAQSTETENPLDRTLTPTCAHSSIPSNPAPPAPGTPIPKIIWTYWNTFPPPPWFGKITEEWKKKSPGWAINKMNDENPSNCVGMDNELPIGWKTAEGPAHRKDVLCKVLLVKYGGICVDASIILYKSLDWVIEKQLAHSKVTEYVGCPAFHNNLDHPTMNNFFMASVAGSVLMQKLKERVFQGYGRRAAYMEQNRRAMGKDTARDFNKDILQALAPGYDYGMKNKDSSFWKYKGESLVTYLAEYAMIAEVLNKNVSGVMADTTHLYDLFSSLKGRSDMFVLFDCGPTTKLVDEVIRRGGTKEAYAGVANDANDPTKLAEWEPAVFPKDLPFMKLAGGLRDAIMELRQSNKVNDGSLIAKHHILG